LVVASKRPFRGGGLALQPGSSAGKPVSIPLPAASTTTRGQTRQFIALSLNPLPLSSGALYFYQYQAPRPLGEIGADIKTLEGEIMAMLKDITQ